MNVSKLRGLFLILSLLLFDTECSLQEGEREKGEGKEPFEREVYLMGTSFKISLYETDENKAVDTTEKIIRIVEATEEQLSTWKPTSELSRLNDQPTGKPFAMSPSLCSLMLKLGHFVQETGAAFDPTVGRLLQAWGIHHQVRVPTQAELNEALATTGFFDYEINAVQCTVQKTKEVLIDAGAFGKGEALDRVLEFAVREDLPPFLLDFGGQLSVWKTPAGSSQWSSAIAKPADRTQPSSVSLHFSSGSVSTSGQSEEQAKQIIGHILDPRSGNPVPAFGSVTVWSASALQADVLSTALFVMGPKNGLEWARKEGIAACFLTNHEIQFTPHFRQFIK